MACWGAKAAMVGRRRKESGLFDAGNVLVTVDSLATYEHAHLVPQLAPPHAARLYVPEGRARSLSHPLRLHLRLKRRWNVNITTSKLGSVRKPHIGLESLFWALMGALPVSAFHLRRERLTVIFLVSPYFTPTPL